VQAAYLGERDDLALVRTLHWSWFRGIFVQAQVGPTPVVIGEIGFEQAVQVSLIEHDDVVQALAADRAYQPFDVRRLPGRARGDPDFLQAQSLGAALEVQAVNAVTVAQQVLRGRYEGEGFPELLGRPSSRRGRYDIEVQNAAAVMRQDNKDVKA
jgi:hypothetical protein